MSSSRVLKKQESFADRFKGRTSIMDKQGVIGVVMNKGAKIDTSNIPVKDGPQDQNDYLGQYDQPDVLTPMQQKIKKPPMKVQPEKQPGLRNQNQDQNDIQASLDVRENVDFYRDSNGNQRYFTKNNQNSNLRHSFVQPPSTQQHQYQQQINNSNLMYTQQLHPSTYFNNQNESQESQVPNLYGTQRRQSISKRNSLQKKQPLLSASARLQQPRSLQSKSVSAGLKQGKLGTKQKAESSRLSKKNKKNDKNSKGQGNNDGEEEDEQQLQNNNNNLQSSQHISNFLNSNINFQGGITQFNGEDYQVIAVPKRFMGNTNNNYNSQSQQSIYSSQQFNSNNNNNLAMSQMTNTRNQNGLQANPSFVRQSQNILNTMTQQQMQQNPLGNSIYSRYGNNMNNNNNNNNNNQFLPNIHSDKFDLATSYLNSQKQYFEDPFNMADGYNGTSLIGQYSTQKNKYQTNNFNSNLYNETMHGKTKYRNNNGNQDFMYQLDELENKHNEIIQSMNSLSFIKKQKQNNYQSSNNLNKPGIKFNY